MKASWKSTLLLCLIFSGLTGFAESPSLKKGDEQFKAQQFEPALASYTKAIEESPTAGAYYSRGATYSALNRFAEAIPDFTKTIELAPDYKGVYWSRGFSYMNLRKPKEAVADYTKSIEKQPEFNKAAYSWRAKIYYNLLEWEKAKADLEEVLKIDPKNPDAKKGLEAIDLQLKARAAGEWTVESARGAAFRLYKGKAELSRFSAKDPDFALSQKLIKKSKGQGGRLPDRFITVEKNGNYVVSLFDEKKIPKVTVFYTREGKTESLRVYSGQEYPRASFIYCYDTCPGPRGEPKKSGDLLGVTWHVSEAEAFYYDINGRLLFHEEGKK